MATSPIYNWPEPDNTDLVKNGALAIRTLGDAIDTTMATMTPKSLVDAKGDLIAASAADTPARLAVGNNGETLVADSSTSTGLRYTAGTVQSNPILNSSFQVWQRGTANITGGYAYTADRWQKGNDTYYGVSRQVTGDTTNLPNIQYCARVQRTAGSTVTTAMQIAQSVESINSIPFAGKTATISFYARAGANYSAASNALAVFFNCGTATDQNILGGYTGGSIIVSQNATLTTTWQRFSYTGTVPSTTTEMGCFFQQTPTGTAGANDYFEVTGVQIDIGSVALPFRTNGGTIQGELAACQRYYRHYQAATSNGLVSANAYSNTTTQAKGFAILNDMRTTPTSISYSNLQFVDYTGTAYAWSSLGIDTSQTNSNFVHIFGAVSGATAGRVGTITGTSSTSYLGISAEL